MLVILLILLNIFFIIALFYRERRYKKEIESYKKILGAFVHDIRGPLSTIFLVTEGAKNNKIDSSEAYNNIAHLTRKALSVIEKFLYEKKSS